MSTVMLSTPTRITPDSYDVAHLYHRWKSEGMDASQMLPRQDAACVDQVDVVTRAIDEEPVKEDFPEMSRREFNAFRKEKRRELEEATEAAKRVCEGCPIETRERCLIAAVAVEDGDPGEMYYEAYGVWGGLSPEEVAEVHDEFVNMRNEDYMAGNLVIRGLED